MAEQRTQTAELVDAIEEARGEVTVPSYLVSVPVKSNGPPVAPAMTEVANSLQDDWAGSSFSPHFTQTFRLVEVDPEDQSRLPPRRASAAAGGGMTAEASDEGSDLYARKTSACSAQLGDFDVGVDGDCSINLGTHYTHAEGVRGNSSRSGTTRTYQNRGLSSGGGGDGRKQPRMHQSDFADQTSDGQYGDLIGRCESSFRKFQEQGSTTTLSKYGGGRSSQRSIRSGVSSVVANDDVGEPFAAMMATPSSAQWDTNPVVGVSCNLDSHS